METASALTSSKPNVPVILFGTAVGSIWLIGGFTLVHRAIPNSIGTPLGVRLVVGAVIFAALSAWIAARDSRLRDHRAKRALLYSFMLPLGSLLGLALLLEGPQTLGPSALPIKLVAGTLFAVVYLAVHLMILRISRPVRVWN